MITQDDINTVLGQACENLGHPVCNAALWRETVPAEVTDEMVEAEIANVRASLVPAADPISLAEQHIEAFFSTARLLQCKVWLDATSREATPKLNSLFLWTATVTGSAVAGATTFSEPPVTFLEVAQECVPLLT